MKFEQPAGTNPIDQLALVGKPLDRVDGPAKTTGSATYAYEQRDLPASPLYGYVVGAGVAKGRITRIDLDRARKAPGVLAVITAADAGPLQRVRRNPAHLFAGPEIEHYHQAVAVVVANSFEQARHAAGLVQVDIARAEGKYDFPAAQAQTSAEEASPKDAVLGDFAKAFAAAPVKLDETYVTPGHAHAMMEPHASIAAWDGGKLTVWTSNQMLAWGREDLAQTLGIPQEDVRLISPYVGGGFGGKLYLQADALLAAIAARVVKRPVKVTLQRPLMFNNTAHRSQTIQRIRIGCDRDGRIQAIGHDGWSGNLATGTPEGATQQTRLLYGGANRLIRERMSVLDLPEANDMRAPGEAPGMMALEIAIDEMAEKLGMDPVRFRALNDVDFDPQNPERKFSQRELVQCLETGAERFGWNQRSSKPGARREGDMLIGLGVAAAFRNNINLPSAARAKLDGDGRITIETDMTDIGTGSYTILAQTAAEMMGVPLEHVTVKLGDSSLPRSAGSGGQFGANSATAGVYAACTLLREQVAAKGGFDPAQTQFAQGRVTQGEQSRSLAELAGADGLSAEDRMEYGDLAKRFQQSTFGAHYVEVGVDVFTGEVRVRRMLAVCAAGRILNPKTARSQVVGAMTMGVGAALMEELLVDKRFGFFVNHDLAGYEVPVHADIPEQEVIFIGDPDPTSSPMKAKGVGELGLCGVGAAVANAVYNATGVRIRDYPITLEKHLERLPVIA